MLCKQTVHHISTVGEQSCGCNNSGCGHDIFMGQAVSTRTPHAEPCIAMLMEILKK